MKGLRSEERTFRTPIRWKSFSGKELPEVESSCRKGLCLASERGDISSPMQLKLLARAFQCQLLSGWEGRFTPAARQSYLSHLSLIQFVLLQLVVNAAGSYAD